MRRLFTIPRDPAFALRVVALLFALIGVAYVLHSLDQVRDLVRSPQSSSGFIFGILNGLASVALFARLEWGRRFALVIVVLWIFIASLGLVLSVLGSMFWAHANLTLLFVWSIALTVVYAWMVGTLMRTDVQCILA